MDIQQRLLEEMQRGYLGSPLGQWMAQHQAELRQLLGGRDDAWETVAEQCRRAGLRDAGGRPCSAETARETWRRVLEAAGRKGRPKRG